MKNLNYILKTNGDLSEVTITGVKEGVKTVTIPDTIKGVPVVHLGVACFKHSALEKVTFKTKHLKTIGYECFENSQIKTIELPEGVEEIDTSAFNKCKNLTRIKFPISLIHAEWGIIQNCPNLQKIEMDEKEPTISYISVENNCLISTTHSVVTYKEVIAGCNKSVIPEGTTLIRMNAFRGSGIKSVTFPIDVKEIKQYAFADCTDLQKVKFAINSNLKKIDCAGFMNTAISQIILPQNIEEINSSAFRDCKNLTHVYTNKKDLLDPYSSWENKSYDKTMDSNAFASCSNLEYVEIPLGIKNIWGNTFSDCSNLRTLSIQRKLYVFDVKNAGKGNRKLKTLITPGEEIKFTSPKKLWDEMKRKVKV